MKLKASRISGMRGLYHKELQFLDNYAAGYGITLVPVSDPRSPECRRKLEGL